MKETLFKFYTSKFSHYHLTFLTSIIFFLEIDPSLGDGFRLIYEREVPFEVRSHSGDEQLRQGTLELIRVKIVLSGADDTPEEVRMELSSEADLFFHYTHQLDETGFAKVQEAQKIMVDLADYPTILVRMLNSCIKEPHIHLGNVNFSFIYRYFYLTYDLS